MRKIYFLLPGTKGKFGGGGLWAELKTINLASQICKTEIVTYRQKESDYIFLTDLLQQDNLQDFIFVVSWGFDVPQLIGKLRDYNIIYHAHSAGYGFDLPANIPVITVSRNSMGYWGQRSPNSLIFYLPNQIGQEFYNQQISRDIDVLVQTRKLSQYVREKLIPTLQSYCHVKIIDGYVEDLAGLFNRSKIYLYDSAEYWGVSGVTEGFGLPPLEALACGCQIFSSVNHGLADYLDPGFNCHKIGCYSLEYDLLRILQVIKSDNLQPVPAAFFEQYQENNLLPRLEVILQEINQFFDFKLQHKSPIPSLTNWRIRQLWVQRYLGKIRNKLKI
ncbi:glycosyltransferase [Xenococcus sp. PCC 7305]|uniref:glycosyltransferase n=1 Tax=Xenococcus sp. PCC 7305 TaxID=102125 RepID=UPI0002AC4B6A|nr:glycosyltransferase [Xenococcus sp. PCC 7305]ELS04850.1 glycosyltransferase [Xenococcus sp. PCC 7305]